MKFLRIIFISAILLSASSITKADTTWVASGAVSGNWTTAGNPYVVYNGDITVQSGNSLIIDPGVVVLFTGNYKFIVNGTLNAEGTESDSIIFTRMYQTEESKWRGFRFEGANGNSSLSYCRIEYAKGTGDYPDVRGGAIWIQNCSFTIDHCLIANSYTHNANYNGAGGGVCFNSNSNGVLEYCTIRLNQSDSGGGILLGSDCNPTVRYNLIEENTAFYAGGGIYVSAGGSGIFHDNTIQANNCSGGWGGGGLNLWCASWSYGSFATVYNNLIIDNTASSAGGGIYSRYDSSILYNNTIAGNSANQGGGIYVITFSYLPPTVYNCIIWGNSASSGQSIFLYTGSGSEVNVSYSDVEGGWAGAGNIDDYPYFAAGFEGEYYLSDDESGQIYDSPCIDAGDPASAMINGTTRTDGELDLGVVDMGFHYPPGGTAGWLDIGINPGMSPIHIPPGGGAFDFEVGIINVGGEGMWFDVWTMVRLPNGSLYGPTKLVQNIWISSLQNLFRQNIVQWVPAHAPSGDYEYICNVGEYPDNIMDSDSFPFDKLAGEAGAVSVGDWEVNGWEADSESAKSDRAPVDFTLLKAYPNPFNPALTIEFALPEDSKVKLEIYNSAGEVAAELIDSYLPAGAHTVNWNAEGHASGLYLVRLSGGGLVITKKYILIK